MGQIITFYSFKGGTGRSMALANIAILLGLWKYKVLIVDWDLEAPGLERFFEEFFPNFSEIPSKKGIVDLLTDFTKKNLTKEEKENWQKFLVKIDIENISPSLRLLTAGKRGPEYFNNVRNLFIPDFYSQSNGGKFIEFLRDEWKKNYDFVLVDSRTGITDIGSVCTIQLPDVLVLLFTPTEQAFNGILDVTKKVFKAQQKLPVDRFSMISIPVPSRIDQAEFELTQRWFNRFSKELQDTYSDWLPGQKDSLQQQKLQLQMLEITKLPYVPYFSFGEKLPVIEHGTNDPSGLGYYYENLAALIANEFEDVKLLLEDRDRFIRKSSKGRDINMIIPRIKTPMKLFLSYSRNDLDDIQEIVNVLCSGGIRIWQDIQSLATGNTEGQISRAIEKECDGLFLYVTDKSVDSEFIRDIELKTAFRMSESDADFFIVPLVRIPLDQANRKLKNIMRGDISRYNAVILQKDEDIHHASQKIRKILLRNLIQKSGKEDFLISLSTYQRTPGTIWSQLDLDWSLLNFSDKLMSQSVWEKHILHALLDVKDALLEAGYMNINLFAKAHLTAGIAIGYVFRRETGFKLNIQQNDQWWAIQSSPEEPSKFRINSESRNIGSKHLAVNISITRLVDDDIGNFIKDNDISFRAEVQCVPENGPSRDAIPNESVAAAIAWKIGNAIRDAKNLYSITDIHIFAAMPLGLACLIGSELNACGRIHLYEFDRSESRYYPSWMLDGRY